MRCYWIIDDGSQCPNTTKIKSARCWKEWGLCGKHASTMFPELYPKKRGHATGGRFGNRNTMSINIFSDQREKSKLETIVLSS